MSTDERRARAIMDAMDTYNIDEPIRHYLARAIRASDEAAGMVLVPRKATDIMKHAGGMALEHPNVWMGGPKPMSISKAGRCFEAMLAAATESDNG